MSTFLKSLLSYNKIAVLTSICTVSASYFLYKKYKRCKDSSKENYKKEIIERIPYDEGEINNTKTEKEEKVEEKVEEKN